MVGGQGNGILLSIEGEVLHDGNLLKHSTARHLPRQPATVYPRLPLPHSSLSFAALESYSPLSYTAQEPGGRKRDRESPTLMIDQKTIPLTVTWSCVERSALPKAAGTPHPVETEWGGSSGTGHGVQSHFPAIYLIPTLSAESPPCPSFTVPAPHTTSSCVCPQGVTCSGQEAGGPDEE